MPLTIEGYLAVEPQLVKLRRDIAYTAPVHGRRVDGKRNVCALLHIHIVEPVP